MIGVSTALSSTNREKLEGYLAHKWGLTGSLSNDHPYKLSIMQAKIAVSSIGTNSATVSADLLDLGGASTVFILPTTGQ